LCFDAATVRKAERLTESCKHCNREGAEREGIGVETFEQGLKQFVTKEDLEIFG